MERILRPDRLLKAYQPKLLPAYRLEHDFVHTLTLPSGMITEAGRDEIESILNREFRSDQPFCQKWKEATGDVYWYWNIFEIIENEVGWDWIASKGLWPKRVFKAVKKKYHVPIPTNLMGKLGDCASRHCDKEPQTVKFEFVTSIDWCAGDFGDRGSCFFNERIKAQDMLMDNGFWGIKFYHTELFHSYVVGLGRAWVKPVEMPIGVSGSEENKTAKGFIVFNGYGLSTVEIARILAFHMGMTYKKISVKNNGNDDGTLYINSGSGYIVTDYGNEDYFDQWDFEIPEPQTKCHGCRGMFDSEDMEPVEDEFYCQSCFDEMFYRCGRCNCTVRTRDANTTVEDQHFCDVCIDKVAAICEKCDKYVLDENACNCNGDSLCPDCFEEHGFHCRECNDGYYECDAKTDQNGYKYCFDCYEDRYIKECEHCNCEIDMAFDDFVTIEGVEFCMDCDRLGHTGSYRQEAKKEVFTTPECARAS